MYWNWSYSVGDREELLLYVLRLIHVVHISSMFLFTSEQYFIVYHYLSIPGCLGYFRFGKNTNMNIFLQVFM